MQVIMGSDLFRANNLTNERVLSDAVEFLTHKQ